MKSWLKAKWNRFLAGIQKPLVLECIRRGDIKLADPTLSVEQRAELLELKVHFLQELRRIEEYLK
jgi:hypothetical protein